MPIICNGAKPAQGSQISTGMELVQVAVTRSWMRKQVQLPTILLISAYSRPFVHVALQE
jgi:hypothetical protein